MTAGLPSERSFGHGVGGVCLAAAALVWWRGSPTLGLVLLVTGTLLELPTDEWHLALRLRPWASGEKDSFVGLSIDRVSGLRIPSGRGKR